MTVSPFGSTPPQGEGMWEEKMRREREQYFSPQQWVPEAVATHGYWHNGSLRRPQVPMWGEHFQPSLRNMDAWTNMYNDSLPGMGMKGG